MKSIIHQENALNLLHEKTESEILKELAVINKNKESCLSKIYALQDKLKNNPPPNQINQTINVFTLSNYHNFSASVEASIGELELELKIINEKLTATQQELAKISYKKNLFANYFNNIKKQDRRLTEKSAEAAIHDQYSHVKSFSSIYKE
jgi:hypothetical protein